VLRVPRLLLHETSRDPDGLGIVPEFASRAGGKKPGQDLTGLPLVRTELRPKPPDPAILVLRLRPAARPPEELAELGPGAKDAETVPRDSGVTGEQGFLDGQHLPVESLGFREPSGALEDLS
jgi:hypothetical protein